MNATNKDDSKGSLQDSLNKIIESLELDELEVFLNNLELFNDSSISSLIDKLIDGNFQDSYTKIFEQIKNEFVSEILSLLPFAISILLIIVLIAVINAIGSIKERNGLGDTAEFIGNLVILATLATLFFKIFTEVKSVVNMLSKDVQLVFPLILTLMTAAGGNASVAVFKPSVTILCSGISTLFDKILLPITLLIFLFSAVNCFTDGLKTDKAGEFLKSTFKWIVGILGVLFTFFVTIQGIAASTYDNVSIRALKYAVGNSIPLINNLLNSGFDVVVASCVLVKNALGILTMVAVIYVIAVPLLKLIVISLALKFLAAVSQSIANEKTVKFLSGTSDCISYLATSLAVIGIVYLITITILICALGTL